MRLFKKADPLQKEKWETLHQKGYHPDLQGALKNVANYPEGKGWIFEDWGRRLEMPHLVNVEGKIVLEIGFGGGWYLAQLMQHGARVIGFEVSSTAMDKAIQLFQHLDLRNYQLFIVDDRYLSILPEKSVDVVFEHTVFQHITEDTTRGYLTSANKIMKEDGMFIAQFLMNENMVVKNPYAKSEGVVYYSHTEVVNLVEKSGFEIVKFVNHEWTDKNNSYWRYYVLNRTR